MNLRQLFESKNSVAIIFGRFNPPHKGHKAAWQIASKHPHWYVGTNQSTQGPKDPLPFDVKIQAMTAIWPEVEDHIVAEQSWLTLASKVYQEHGEVTLFCLTDEEWVTKTIVQYNGKEGTHGFYNFPAIKQQATPRLSSATALRDAVIKGDREAFSHAAGVPADTEVAGHPFFDLVAHYLMPYQNAPKKVAKKKVKEPTEMMAPPSSPNFSTDGGHHTLEAGYGRNRGYHHGFASPHAPSLGGRRDIDDEANLMYIYRDGRVKQRMVSNHEERSARAEGFRDSIEKALGIHGIIRSKFDPKKWVQKQGMKWIQVYPFGQPDPTPDNKSEEPNEGLGESPIEMDPAEPMNPMIHSHEKANPAKLQYRMLRAQKQLADLAQRAQNASPAEWQTISKHFDELAMNIGQIKHGLEELAKVRRKGGVRSRGIDPIIEP